VIAISLGTLGILVFILSCSLLGGTIYFLLDSIKNMRAVKDEQQQQNYTLNFTVVPEQVEVPSTSPSPLSSLRSLLKNKKHISTPQIPIKNSPSFSKELKDKESLISLKETFQEQNKLLNSLLKGLELLETTPQDSDIKNKLEEMELILEDKEEELHKLHRQNEVTKKMMMRFEDVQKEFLVMQNKMATLEKQAAGANNLMIELEDTREAFNQLKKEWSRKNEQLQATLSENQRMHQQICETEDKLEEANLQRQQLFKKVKVLEEMNADLQSLSDAHQRLQRELRRIGELESMLNMMTQERDQLLGKGLQ
jgi:DNA repair exonuclease SbcCD ATPase subunit